MIESSDNIKRSNKKNPLKYRVTLEKFWICHQRTYQFSTIQADAAGDRCAGFGLYSLLS